MAWNLIRTEPLTGPDGTEWEVDLLGGEIRILDPTTGKVLPPMQAGRTERGVKASCHKEGNHQFEVVAWRPSTPSDAEKDAVMKDAGRRIREGEWEFSQTYEL